MTGQRPKPSKNLDTVGLFAGIGGIERGLEAVGHPTILLVENFLAANHVLKLRFPDSKLLEDVVDLRRLPKDVELVTAGFPCQDLSSVGPKIGIDGTKSSLVGKVFDLLQHGSVPWVLLENVPFLLDLDRGRALRLITSALEELGYNWAYRVIDAEAFGVPQRRRRWYLVASLVGDPRDVLLSGEALRPKSRDPSKAACGFYWTEGTRALGWAVDAVPPIKCGSTVGVPSPPAIWMPDGTIVTPDIRDAERLQGFPVDWTKPAQDLARPSLRWRLVGNAVCVPVASWIGNKLINPISYDASSDMELAPTERWPKAAWGGEGRTYRSAATDTPVWHDRLPLIDFLQFQPKALSARAALGFLGRARKGCLRFADGFLNGVELHAKRQEAERRAR